MSVTYNTYPEPTKLYMFTDYVAAIEAACGNVNGTYAHVSPDSGGVSTVWGYMDSVSRDIYPLNPDDPNDPDWFADVNYKGITRYDPSAFSFEVSWPASSYYSLLITANKTDDYSQASAFKVRFYLYVYSTGRIWIDPRDCLAFGTSYTWADTDVTVSTAQPARLDFFPGLGVFFLNGTPYYLPAAIPDVSLSNISGYRSTAPAVGPVSIYLPQTAPTIASAPAPSMHIPEAKRHLTEQHVSSVTRDVDYTGSSGVLKYIYSFPSFVNYKYSSDTAVSKPNLSIFTDSSDGVFYSPYTYQLEYAFYTRVWLSSGCPEVYELTYPIYHPLSSWLKLVINVEGVYRYGRPDAIDDYRSVRSTLTIHSTATGSYSLAKTYWQGDQSGQNQSVSGSFGAIDMSRLSIAITRTAVYINGVPINNFFHPNSPAADYDLAMGYTEVDITSPYRFYMLGGGSCYSHSDYLQLTADNLIQTVYQNKGVDIVGNAISAVPDTADGTTAYRYYDFNLNPGLEVDGEALPSTWAIQAYSSSYPFYWKNGGLASRFINSTYKIGYVRFGLVASNAGQLYYDRSAPMIPTYSPDIGVEFDAVGLQETTVGVLIQYDLIEDAEGPDIRMEMDCYLDISFANDGSASASVWIELYSGDFEWNLWYGSATTSIDIVRIENAMSKLWIEAYPREQKIHAFGAVFDFSDAPYWNEWDGERFGIDDLSKHLIAPDWKGLNTPDGKLPSEVKLKAIVFSSSNVGTPEGYPSFTRVTPYLPKTSRFWRDKQNTEVI